MIKIKLVEENNRQENRIEFFFDEFPYVDGNDLIISELKKKYDLREKEKIDGIYFSIQSFIINNYECCFVWHEDIGNYAYCLPQTKATVNDFKEKILYVIKVLNDGFISK